MSLAALANTLGQTVMPSVCAATMPDTMTIKAETASSIGAGGERIKGTASDYKTSVPCSYEPILQRRGRITAGDKAVSIQQYKMTMPTHHSGRINLDPKTHRFIVNGRGTEPAKTFRIIAVGDISGVVFEVVVEREG